MAKKPQGNRERLNSATRTLQLLQRTNPPSSAVAKSATKALDILLKAITDLPVESAAPIAAPAPTPPDLLS